MPAWLIIVYSQDSGNFNLYGTKRSFEIINVKMPQPCWQSNNRPVS